MLSNPNGLSDSEFMNPEEKARQRIDAMLTASGWEVQSKDAVNLSAARGVAVCELPLSP
jgi:type I restriction enzyme R subunit